MTKLIIILLFLSGCATSPAIIGPSGYTAGILDSGVFEAQIDDSAEVQKIKKKAKKAVSNSQMQIEELRMLYEERIRIIMAEAENNTKSAKKQADIANKNITNLEKELKLWQLIGGVGYALLAISIIWHFWRNRMK